MRQKLLRSFFVGIAFAIGIAIVPALAGLATFTGPSGSNPINFPAVLGDMNKLILSLNGEVFNYVSLSTTAAEVGELQMLNGNAFAVNGTVATSLTSLGPPGAHTTVQEWLLVMDSAGNARYIPAF